MPHRKTLLAVFAHPDDEAFGVGGTLARYAAQGVRVVLACATRGEAGQISDPSLATPENLGRVREEELRCAARALGVREVIFLGYRDSGMAGDRRNADPRAYVSEQTPPPLVVGKVLETKHNPRNGQDLVRISIGSDDGLLKGHKVYVYRVAQGEGSRPTYLGQIRIDLVTPDQAVGTVIERAKNGVIEKGDNVTTKL